MVRHLGNFTRPDKNPAEETNTGDEIQGPRDSVQCWFVSVRVRL